MASSSEVRNAASALGLKLTDSQVDRLAAGAEIEIDASEVAAPEAKGDCDCGEGWIGIGHKPRWCIRISPPGLKILPNC